MIFTYIDSSDISLSNGANRSSLSRFIQKLLKKHQGLLYFETDISNELLNHAAVRYIRSGTDTQLIGTGAYLAITNNAKIWHASHYWCFQHSCWSERISHK